MIWLFFGLIGYFGFVFVFGLGLGFVSCWLELWVVFYTAYVGCFRLILLCWVCFGSVWFTLVCLPLVLFCWIVCG